MVNSEIHIHGLWLRKHAFFTVFLLAIGLWYGSSLLVFHDPWWDSSVYIGMGKYIWSLGEAGLWEPARPLVWPMLLGFLWKMGLDPLFWGQVITILFSLGIVFFTYLIGSSLWPRKVAFFGAFFTALFPIYFSFVNILHAEIPSLFFLMLSLYFIIRGRFAFAGFFSGLSFLARFYQLFSIIGIISFMIFIIVKQYKTKNKKKLKEVWKNLVLFLVPFLILAALYLIANVFLYGNPFYPFLLQAYLTMNTGEMSARPFVFYFIELFLQNPLIPFALLGILYSLRMKEKNAILLVSVFLFSFIPYLFVAHKELRLVIAVIPLLSLLISLGFITFIGKLKMSKYLVFFSGILLWSFLALPQLEFSAYEDGLDAFYGYSKNIPESHMLLISNPSFIVHTDRKADLLYYPRYGTSAINAFTGHIDEYDDVLMNSCDLLPCHAEDKGCAARHLEFIDLLKKSHKVQYEQNVGGCEHIILGRK